MAVDLVGSIYALGVAGLELSAATVMDLTSGPTVLKGADML